MAGHSKTSPELLAVTGDGSSRSVVENLLRQPNRGHQRDKPRTFKVARSPLLDHLQTFLPEFQRSTEQLLSRPQQQLHHLNIENTEDDRKVIEMNLLVGQRESGEQEDEERGMTSREDSSDNDSEDDLLQGRRVTMENMHLPGNILDSQQRNLIEVVSENTEERSDGEETVASSASGER